MVQDLIHGENPNYYTSMFQRVIAKELSISAATILVAEAYLDGKPAKRGKFNISQTQRDELFWSCEFLFTAPTSAYFTEPFVLALARYMQQDKVAHFELLQQVAAQAPETVRKAVRYSGLVLKQKSQRWNEIEQLGTISQTEFGDFIQVCRTFGRAHRERTALVEKHRKPLAALSPLELLAYASLYAFENLVPIVQSQTANEASTATEVQSASEAINNILLWKLETTTDESFHLTDTVIGDSLRVHLSPFLFPSPTGPQIRQDIYDAFGQLVETQLEMNSFMTQSVDAFCYDESINFELVGATLVIVECNPDARVAWQQNGTHLARLHTYWFYRATEAFAASDLATEQIGSPENHEMNQVAYIKAIRSELQLTEVYGLETTVATTSGLQVNLFQALLSLELMTAFFIKNFLQPYEEHLSKTGNWRASLMQLAMGGLMQSTPQIRFPLTWSERSAKIESILPWTVSKHFPQGHAKAAEAILDFWTNDLGALSSRLRKGDNGLKHPDFSEKPVLKLGHYLFQLPWMVASQNNSTAAINNLRRIGARRAETKDETQRIENRLAKRFEERGFLVRVNYQPARVIDDDPGEVDLICTKDGYLLVLEVKSSYLRKSLKEVWLHKTVTLRKAGLQLQRKIAAVSAAITSDAELALALGIRQGGVMPTFHGWIVDTSIEHNHEYFSGFLKVSLEEILIALRDDRHLLNDQEGWFSGRVANLEEETESKVHVTSTLYPDGFSCGHFIDVILQQAVWGN